MVCRRAANFSSFHILSMVKLSASSAHVKRPAMKGRFVKKAKSPSDELRVEYKRSDFGRLQRGKYYERVKAGSNVVVLDPEVATVFPNSRLSIRRSTLWWKWRRR